MIHAFWRSLPGRGGGQISIPTPNARAGFDVDCLLVDPGIQATQAVRDPGILEFVAFSPLAEL